MGQKEKGSQLFGYPSLISSRGRGSDGYCLRRLRTFAAIPAKPVPSRSIVVGSGTAAVGDSTLIVTGKKLEVSVVPPGTRPCKLSVKTKVPGVAFDAMLNPSIPPETVVSAGTLVTKFGGRKKVLAGEPLETPTALIVNACVLGFVTVPAKMTLPPCCTLCTGFVIVSTTGVACEFIAAPI